ncbi:polysaccharide deacetylase family protein [Sphingomonas sp. Tas61C01]|uniref:polysaccharide deacetylase family protein n=1 Tax=Sphingomonas sp. Tas61C01 TaxID=3458297 RepID=UPI00403EC1C8
MTPTPYRVLAPAPDQLIDWPASFGTRYLVCVDVEEEFDWRAPLDPRNRSTTAMSAFPAAHRWFADRAIGLACFVDHPVASDARAVEILRQVAADGGSEIGAQLHAWVTPPYAAAAPGDSYAGNLPIEEERAKLAALTDLLRAAFGGSPRIYRAGRYGIGARTLGLLRDQGYLIDSSVRARYDYRADLGPDFGAVGNAAYRLGGLIELPLSSVFTGRFRGIGPSLYRGLSRVPRGRGTAARSGMLQRVALTPEDMPIAEALEAVTVAVANGERLLTFSFHSPTLVPGNTPYVRDAADLARFWRWWAAMAAHLDRLGVRATTIGEIIAASGQAGTP